MTDNNSTTALEEERKRRLHWLASILGEPVEDVTLAPDVEPVAPDPHKCGAGKGAECCIFLTCGANGFICERHGPTDGYLRKLAADGEMGAQRAPETPYPDCMIFGEQENKEC